MLNFSWFHISPPYWKFQFLFLSMILFLLVVFLDRRQPCPIKLVLLVIIGWSVGWWVRNAVFSEKARRIFLIFCMKSGEAYKSTEPDFWEKFKLLWRYSLKGLQLSRKSDNLIFFSKTAVTIFLVFGLWCKFEKMTKNLNLRNFLTVSRSYISKLQFFFWKIGFIQIEGRI